MSDTPERLRLDWLYENIADPECNTWPCLTCDAINGHEDGLIECKRCGFQLDDDRVRDALMARKHDPEKTQLREYQPATAAIEPQSSTAVAPGENQCQRSAATNSGHSKKLDAITDVVLAYRPKPKSKPAKKRERRANKQERIRKLAEALGRHLGTEDLPK